MDIAGAVGNLVGGDILTGIKGLLGMFVKTPEQQAAIAEATMQLQQHEDDIKAAQAQAQVDLQKQALVEQGQNLRAESSSNDPFVRRARPAFLWVITAAIGVNLFLPLLSQFFGGHLQPLAIPTPLFDLFGVAFTGYTAARTYEKLQSKD